MYSGGEKGAERYVSTEYSSVLAHSRLEGEKSGSVEAETIACMA